MPCIPRLLLTDRVSFSAMPARLLTRRLELAPEALTDAAWLAELFTTRGQGAVSVEEARERIRAMHQLTREQGIGAYVLRPRDGGARWAGRLHPTARQHRRARSPPLVRL